jgi:hypothetical protein
MAAGGGIETGAGPFPDEIAFELIRLGQSGV